MIASSSRPSPSSQTSPCRSEKGAPIGPAHSEGSPMVGKKADRASVEGQGQHGGVGPYLTHQGGEFRSEQGVCGIPPRRLEVSPQSDPGR